MNQKHEVVLYQDREYVSEFGREVEKYLEG